MRYAIQVEKNGVKIGKLLDKKLSKTRAQILRKKLIKDASNSGCTLVILPA